MTHLESVFLVIQTPDVSLQTLYGVTDHWVSKYRHLDVPYIFAGTAVGCHIKVSGKNKINRVYQGA